MRSCGKKKKHALKSQIVINQSNKQIVCTAHSKGKEHDFSLFKKSKTCLTEKIMCLGDKGYQGIKKIHKLSQIPHKKPRKKELSKKQKQENRNLASIRIVVEHVYRSLKIFRCSFLSCISYYKRLFTSKIFFSPSNLYRYYLPVIASK